jgi:hypothetical protein
MSSIAFDTLKFVETLQAAGVPASQAKAMAEAFREATSEELVTRNYLDAKLAELRGDFRTGQLDLVKWFAGLLIAQAALIAALVKLL